MCGKSWGYFFYVRKRYIYSEEQNCINIRKFYVNHYLLLEIISNVKKIIIYIFAVVSVYTRQSVLFETSFLFIVDKRKQLTQFVHRT